MRIKTFTFLYGYALRALVAIFPYVWDESCLKARRECMRSFWKNAA